MGSVLDLLLKRRGFGESIPGSSSPSASASESPSESPSSSPSAEPPDEVLAFQVGEIFINVIDTTSYQVGDVMIQG